MSNDTTKDLPHYSTQETADSIGFDLSVAHEKDHVVIVQSMRIPRGEMLRDFIDALSANDGGYHRLGGPSHE